MSSFYGMTTAQLETLRDNLLASINRSATSAQGYSGPAESLQRMDPDKAMRILSEVNEELFARQDETGGIGHGEFEDAE